MRMTIRRLFGRSDPPAPIDAAPVSAIAEISNEGRDTEGVPAIPFAAGEDFVTARAAQLAQQEPEQPALPDALAAMLVRWLHDDPNDAMTWLTQASRRANDAAHGITAAMREQAAKDALFSALDTFALESRARRAALSNGRGTTRPVRGAWS